MAGVLTKIILMMIKIDKVARLSLCERIRTWLDVTGQLYIVILIFFFNAKCVCALRRCCGEG